jgi:Zinc dependent phospholipase C
MNMPGGFTHFAVVRRLGINIELMSIEGMTQEIADALQLYSKYLELGAVSPDLPYLAPFSHASNDWGNALHHRQTVEPVRTGIWLLPRLIKEKKERDMATAWLFGYASHVVADMISHPVVTKKVGKYENNKPGHRVCELSQDTYIFKKYFKDDITNCEYLDSGVKACTADGLKGTTLAPFLKNFFEGILAMVYRDMDIPDTGWWFRQYVTLIDKVAEDGNLFVSCFRGSMEEDGLVYPEEPNVTYVNELVEPYSDRVITFDDLFERFQAETKKVWGQMAKAITANDETLVALANGDLDTGIDLADGKTSVFWNQKGVLA